MRGTRCYVARLTAQTGPLNSLCSDLFARAAQGFFIAEPAEGLVTPFPIEPFPTRASLQLDADASKATLVRARGGDAQTGARWVGAKLAIGARVVDTERSPRGTSEKRVSPAIRRRAVEAIVEVGVAAAGKRPASGGEFPSAVLAQTTILVALAFVRRASVAANASAWATLVPFRRPAIVPNDIIAAVRGRTSIFLAYGTRQRHADRLSKKPIADGIVTASLVRARYRLATRPPSRFDGVTRAASTEHGAQKQEDKNVDATTILFRVFGYN